MIWGMSSSALLVVNLYSAYPDGVRYGSDDTALSLNTYSVEAERPPISMLHSSVLPLYGPISYSYEVAPWTGDQLKMVFDI